MRGNWLTRTSSVRRLIGGRERSVMVSVGAEAAVLLLWILEVSEHTLHGDKILSELRPDLDVYLGLAGNSQSLVGVLCAEGWLVETEWPNFVEVGQLMDDGMVRIHFDCVFTTSVMEAQAKAKRDKILADRTQRLHVKSSDSEAKTDQASVEEPRSAAVSDLIDAITAKSDKVASESIERRRKRAAEKPPKPKAEPRKTSATVFAEWKVLYSAQYGEQPESMFNGGKLSAEGGRMSTVVKKAGSVDAALAFIREVMGRHGDYAKLYRHAGVFDGAFLLRIVGEVTFAQSRDLDPIKHIQSIKSSPNASGAKDKAKGAEFKDDF